MFNNLHAKLQLLHLTKTAGLSNLLVNVKNVNAGSKFTALHKLRTKMLLQTANHDLLKDDTDMCSNKYTSDGTLQGSLDVYLLFRICLKHSTHYPLTQAENMVV